MTEPADSALRSAGAPFDDLRADVETNTYLPEFHEVEARSRRVKRRLRLRTAAAALAVAVPAASAFVVVYQQPRGEMIGVTGHDNVVHLSLPSSRPVADTWTLVAADGIDLDHLYGLVDVCSAGACTLELSSIDPNSVTGTVQKMDLFRSRPTDNLANPRLVALGASSVQVGAQVNSGSDRSDTLGVTSPSSAPPATAAKRAIQPTPAGLIEVANAHGAVTAAPSQPKLSQPTLLSTRSGWWVSGTDPISGALTLAVSDDSGKSWANRPMNIQTVQATPALAVSGDTVYVLVAAGGHLQLRKSTDRGLNWSTLTAPDTWPPTSRYGIIIRPDKSVLVWLERSGGTASLLHSKDGGLTFAADHGAATVNGTIVTLADGYVMLGSNAYLSRDAETWTLLQVPWLPQS